jgi:hypothetical protein
VSDFVRFVLLYLIGFLACVIAPFSFFWVVGWLASGGRF